MKWMSNEVPTQGVTPERQVMQHGCRNNYYVFNVLHYLVATELADESEASDGCRQEGRRQPARTSRVRWLEMGRTSVCMKRPIYRL
eukprot:976883-Pleurochrysis_carterae.AAC.2